MSRQAAAATTLLLASAAVPAWAAGGAHLVDDAAVETAGVCHTEDWAGAGGRHVGVVSLGGACTPTGLPWLELGASVNRSWADGGRQTLVGLMPKAQLRAEDTGFGVAVSGLAGWDGSAGQLGSAAVTLPLTLPLARGARLHVNAGWEWVRGGGSSAFSGIQLEWPLLPGLGWMVETFRRDPGRAGAQTGLRWTTGGGTVDLDILVGRYVDGATRSMVTLGFTLRH